MTFTTKNLKHFCHLDCLIFLSNLKKRKNEIKSQWKEYILYQQKNRHINNNNAMTEVVHAWYQLVLRYKSPNS